MTNNWMLILGVSMIIVGVLKGVHEFRKRRNRS